MTKTCSIGRIRKTQRKPQEEVTSGRKEEPPNLQFTNYPACLRASLQIRKTDFKWLEKLNHEKNMMGKLMVSETHIQFGIRF